MIFGKRNLPPHLQLKRKPLTIILFSVVIILFISLILTNLNLLTGKAIYKDKPIEEGIAQTPEEKEPTTIIKVSPDPLKRGLYMTITLTTGNTGADEKLTIYNQNGWKEVENLNMNCNGPTCFDETIIKIYKSNTGWEPGKYSIVAKDWATSDGTEVVTYFEVIE